MLTKEELTEVYKKFDNEKIVKLALHESKSLREDVIPILEHEILIRNLNKNLLDWIRLERNFFKGTELSMVKNIIKDSVCTKCGKKNEKVKGFNISYRSFLDSTFNANLILCESCGRNLRNQSYLKTVTLGLVSKRGIIAVPFYFIDELICSFSREKKSVEIIESFIFEHTGLIREKGIEKIKDLIAQNNQLQMKDY